MAISIYVASNVYAQISPGELTTAHANLEGMKNCTECHELGEGIDNAKCLDCHTEINSRVKSNIGYHASKEVKIKECIECHSEHHGREFKIINFSESDFDHDLTSFTLKGKHKKEKCASCHKTEFLKTPSTQNEVNKHKILSDKILSGKKTFLGLSQRCENCHIDYHDGSLGNECKNCHDADAFRPASLFDHQKTKFGLIGAHLKTDCVKCHAKTTVGEKETQKFNGLNFSSCSACHKDSHNGKFGSQCSGCHTTNSFADITNRKKINHSLTDFQLIGLHNSVDCSKCHTTAKGLKPKHSQCTNCHEDYHKGQLKKLDANIDCNECHNEHGFSPSLYTLELHSKTQFELKGSHQAVPCFRCHKSSKELVFVFTNISCVQCHQNIHEGKISAKFIPNNDCSVCHNEERWSSVTFQHSQTKFELKGKHLETECRSCHFSKVGENLFEQHFTNISSNCEDCHKDTHFGQFKVLEKTNCFKCHEFENWNPVKFLHSNARFKIDGAHLNVECGKCHKSQALPNGVFVKYKFQDINCESCHA
ncbi:MAG: cytochrome C [Bacteroidetes bacterium]|nr:cytochrome C [Bacteroidota bacterium]